MRAALRSATTTLLPPVRTGTTVGAGAGGAGGCSSGMTHSIELPRWRAGKALIDAQAPILSHLLHTAGAVSEAFTPLHSAPRVRQCTTAPHAKPQGRHS